MNNQISENCGTKIEDEHLPREISKNVVSLDSGKISDTFDNTEHMYKFSEELKDVQTLFENKETVATNNFDENSTNSNLLKLSNQVEINDKQLGKIQETIKENQSSLEHLSCNDVIDHKDRLIKQNVISDVLIISDTTIQQKSKQSEQFSSILVIPPEKKVKKIERQKSKPVPPPSLPLKMNRDECDWDSLFDDNGDCLDPTLIEEVSICVSCFYIK